VAQMIEHLPSKHEALSLIPVLQKKKKKKKKKNAAEVVCFGFYSQLIGLTKKENVKI
jgi:hypothetical protein